MRQPIEASSSPVNAERDIKNLLEKGRSDTFDWAEEQSPVELIATIMVAMANHQGGVLASGISGGDKPHITGVHDSAETIDRVLESALSLDPPLIIPLPDVITVEGKPIIITRIPSGMPHVYSLGGRYLARNGSSNEALKPRELRRLMIERGEIHFEAEIALGTSLEDIDWEKTADYVKNLKAMGKASVEDILAQRGCLAKRGDDLFPTNAGILLFGKEPQRIMRGTDITAVRFAGIAMSDTFSRQDITGTLPDQIRRAETFLIDHLRKGVELQDKMERRERFEYPMEAARELVVNAVAHRDYAISGDGIRLFIFQDHLEVSSPGKLPGPVTIANIKDERFSRNPIIVQVLSDMGFIERLGYGVDRVIELMRQQDLHAPQFSETRGGFRVILYNENYHPPEEMASASGHEVAEVLAEYEGVPINFRQETALLYLNKPGNTRITNSELQRLFPDVHAETIRRDLADLVTKNILSKMGEKRGSYYVLKRDDTAQD